MGSTNCKILPNRALNTECPICLDKIDSGILLKCGHYYHNYCIQKASVDFIYCKKEVTCPLCRDEVSEYVKSKIFENWCIPSFCPIDWCQYNTCKIDSKLFSLKKMNSIKLLNNNLIIIPIYYYKKFFMPLFFHSELTYVNSTGYTFWTENIEYQDLSNIYSLCLGCKVPSLKWYNIVNNLNKYKNHANFKNSHFKNILSKSKRTMFFYIRDPENIVIYNERDGTMTTGLIMLNQKCVFLFRTFFYFTNNNIYLINNLYSILYK